jgi:glycolate oxidase FAD binding subunit
LLLATYSLLLTHYLLLVTYYSRSFWAQALRPYLLPTPYSLLLTPYSLLPTPYSLLLTPSLMTNAIAELITSKTNCQAAITKFDQMTHFWQDKIKQLGLKSPESVYLVCSQDIEVLANVVKIAIQEKIPIIPCGNGSKLDWGSLIKQNPLLVSTQKCDRIIEHAVDDLTVTVEAGVKLADLQAKLRANQQFLPIDPAFPTTATIGGILATADTGSFRQGYGGIRDLVLGISFIRGDGEIAKAGGKVVKNVAGYDLMKLFIGSYGTLGVISQVTFRTYPLPQASQTLVITGEAEAIDRAIQLLRNSALTPTAADLITASVAQKLDLGSKIALLVRFQAIPESIEAQANQLATMLQDKDLAIAYFQEEAEQTLWEGLTDLVRIPQSPQVTIGKLGILPTAGVKLVQQLASITPHSDGVIHIGSGIGILQLDATEVSIISQIRNFCQSYNGFFSVLTAPLEIKENLDLWGYQGNALEMMQTIKHKFDPQHIFNCDRYLV